MIIYPLIADTFKNQDRLLYSTYDAIGINMLKYNNDSSNVFRLIDVACFELDSSGFDVNYQLNLTLNNLDFVTIDRINKFKIENISAIENISGVYESNQILGYSQWTNKEFYLKYCGNFTDFVRHSFPSDAFLESNINKNADMILLTLLPGIKNDILLNCDRSRITLNILSDILTPLSFITENYNPKIKNNLLPYIKVFGLDLNYKEISEQIDIVQIENLISKNEYIRITGVLCFGLQSAIDIVVEPYVKNKLVSFTQNIIDREEQYEYDTVCTVDQYNKHLVLFDRNNSNSYIAEYITKEKVKFNIGENDNILDYHIDNNNHIIYMIVEENGITKSLYMFPLILPYNRDNLGLLKNSEVQSVKIEYFRDTLLEKYIVDIFPSEKAHGVDSISIYSREIIDKAKILGAFQLPTVGDEKIYNIGDVVSYNNEYWICKQVYVNDSIFQSTATLYETQNYENRVSSLQVLENPLYWRKEIVLLKEDLIIDLLRLNIETNRFEFTFEELFSVNDESILIIEVSGVHPSSLEILVQNKKLNKFFSKTLEDLFHFNDPTSLLFTEDTVFPVLNKQDQLLVDRINSYDVGFIDTYSINDHRLYYVSSRNYVSINGYNIVPVFDTFYFDEANLEIITSDTISHIFNQSDITGVEGKAVSGWVDADPNATVDMQDKMLSDKENNIFLER